MSTPFVSCIVPVYNGERFLGEALDSILAQTYSLLDVVVVDDGSTDGTHTVVAEYLARVRYIAQAHAGASVARNTGIAAARGELIAFLDADDLWQPDKIALQVEHLQSRSELAASLCHIQNFWMPEVQEEGERLRDHPRGQPMAAYVTGALLAPGTLFDAVGLFNPALKHGDAAEWFLRVEESGARVEVLPQVLLLRRLHAANTSRIWAQRSRDEFLNLIKARLDRQRAGRKQRAEDT